MCTVVVRWSPEQPVRVLALRDELTSRPFDDPGMWWPDTPDVVGGRDRAAGGTWCASHVPSGRTALVLNRPQKRTAEEGAPSRGLLPLWALGYGREWPLHVDVAGMASFALLLAEPDSLGMWVFDGTALTSTALPEGTHMVTSGGAEDGKAARYLPLFADEDWQGIVQGEVPQDDPAALVVRHQKDDLVFATVFGQLIDSAPGGLDLAWSRAPWQPGEWARTTFG